MVHEQIDAHVPIVYTWCTNPINSELTAISNHQPRDPRILLVQVSLQLLDRAAPAHLLVLILLHVLINVVADVVVAGCDLVAHRIGKMVNHLKVFCRCT